jgi:hypothetical protein
VKRVLFVACIASHRSAIVAKDGDVTNVESAHPAPELFIYLCMYFWSFKFWIQISEDIVVLSIPRVGGLKIFPIF